MNKTKRITFAQFNAILKELGFARKVVPQKGVAYRHETTGALLFIRLHKANDLVPQYILVATRGQLDRQGIIDAKEFDAMFHSAAA